MLILLKRPCSVLYLFKKYRNEFSRFFVVVEVYFQREKSEKKRLKLDANQDGVQGSQQNKNLHGSEVKYFTREDYGFSFCRRELHAKSAKKPSSI